MDNNLQIPQRILMGPGPSNVHPRVLEAAAPPHFLDPVRLPKSIAFPNVEIVIYSIRSDAAG